jgi:hypothetical protein
MLVLRKDFQIKPGAEKTHAKEKALQDQSKESPVRSVLRCQLCG